MAWPRLSITAALHWLCLLLTISYVQLTSHCSCMPNVCGYIQLHNCALPYSQPWQQSPTTYVANTGAVPVKLEQYVTNAIRLHVHTHSVSLWYGISRHDATSQAQQQVRDRCAPTVLAQARPKTTMSSRELAPSLLAPCTDAEAASPHASKPGTTALGSSLVGLTT